MTTCLVVTPRDEIRAYLARLLGWTDERKVESALRSVELAAERHAELMLCGAGGMVPIARALHRRASAPSGRSSCAIRSAATPSTEDGARSVPHR